MPLDLAEIWTWASCQYTISHSSSVGVDENIDIYFRELEIGVPVFDEEGNLVGDSKKAAKKAVTQVVISRNIMAAPGMCKLYRTTPVL
jgi:hypothetical protein